VVWGELPAQGQGVQDGAGVDELTWFAFWFPCPWVDPSL
jgi:hypothetical protein